MCTNESKTGHCGLIIEALASTMNPTLDKLEDSDNAHRAFFSDASHELRSPLSTLVTTAEVASLDDSGKTPLALPHTRAEPSRVACNHW